MLCMHYLLLGFLAKIHYSVLIFLTYARCPAHIIFLDFMTTTNIKYRVKIMKPLCSFSLVFSYFLFKRPKKNFLNFVLTECQFLFFPQTGFLHCRSIKTHKMTVGCILILRSLYRTKEDVTLPYDSTHFWNSLALAVILHILCWKSRS